MARAKSTSGKGRTSKTQAEVPTPAGVPDVNAAPVTQLSTTEVKPEASAIAAAIKPTRPSRSRLGNQVRNKDVRGSEDQECGSH